MPRAAANYVAAAFSGDVDYPRKHRALKQFLVEAVAAHVRLPVGFQPALPEDEIQGDYLPQQLHRLPGHAAVPDEVKRARASRPIRCEPLCADRPTRTSAPSISTSHRTASLYILDWFNPLIGHMQHSIRDPNRDHTHGRVWRITLQEEAAGRARVLIAGEPIETSSCDALKTYEDRAPATASAANCGAGRRRTSMAAVDKVAAPLRGREATRTASLLELLWVKPRTTTSSTRRCSAGVPRPRRTAGPARRVSGSSATGGTGSRSR